MKKIDNLDKTTLKKRGDTTFKIEIDIQNKTYKTHTIYNKLYSKSFGWWLMDAFDEKLNKIIDGIKCMYEDVEIIENGCYDTTINFGDSLIGYQSIRIAIKEDE